MSLHRPPMAVVVDASSMVEVLIGATSWTERIGEWQDVGAMLLAPQHFGVETANALVKGVGLDPLDAISRLQQLFLAGVELVDRGLPALYDSIELAGRHGLTVYDAVYLQLVLEVEGELATCDRALASAARAEGIAVIT